MRPHLQSQGVGVFRADSCLTKSSLPIDGDLVYNTCTLVSRNFDDMPVNVLAPDRAVRVIPSEIWGQILQDWHNYQQNVDPEPPLLGRPGGDEAYFTDPESIFVCNDASDFGIR